MIEKTTHTLAFALLTVFATGGGLSPASTGAVEATSVIESGAAREINSPAGPGTVEPRLSVGPDGRVYLSWLEPVQPKGYALKFVVRARDGRWSASRTITQGENQFDSSILALPDGSLAAHWLATGCARII
jgi:hypothetical protein